MRNKFLLKRPLVTEKTTELGGYGKYAFLVDSSLPAPEAKQIVEEKYGVKVVKTNVINAKSKVRRLGQSVGKRSGYKKIIMTLEKGQKLDIMPQ